MALTARQRRQLFWILCAYTVFVVYGSLVPLQWREHTLTQALAQFAQIPWLDLGAVSRADWVANIVLYLPLAFLASAIWIGEPRHGLPLFRIVAILAFCVGLAIAVEFTQIFFAPRTVSLNDLVAEGLGSLGGVLIWLFWRTPLLQLWLDFQAGGRRSLRGAAAGMLLAYLGLAFFPFDFVLSSAELAEKWQAGHIALLITGNEGLLRTGARLGAELVAIMPLGLLLSLLARNLSLPRTLMLGLLLGLLLELAQLFIYSGVTQGASVLMRGLGLAAGAALGLWVESHGLQAPARWIRRLSPLAMLVYLPVLFALAGWAKHDTLGLQQGLARIPDIVWLPFYFHYYSTEPVAVASLLANLAIYAPLGILAWALQMRRVPELRSSAWQPASWALMLATLVEGSKLFLNGGHPDPTNLLIGAFGAGLAYTMAAWLERVSLHGDQPVTAGEATLYSDAAENAVPSATSAFKLNPGRLALALPVGLLLLFGIFQHPLPLIVVPLLAGLMLWLWKKPDHWLIALPAALPVLNLAPWSGRQLLDLFDLLILTVLALSYWRAPMHWPKRERGLLGLLLLSTLLGLWPGLSALPTSTSIVASHGGFEALLVGKGVLWALLLLPVLMGIAAERRWQLLLRGLSLGLVLLTIWVIWERQVFVGLLAFDNVFRVTGGFAQMYSGGAYIEAYIALAFPALLWTSLVTNKTSLRILGTVFAALAAYAMMVTFSRGGYAGLLVAVVLSLLFYWRRQGSRIAWGPLLGVALAAAVALPVFLGGFAQQRMAQIGEDLHTRLTLWSDAIALMDGKGWLLGMGFGQYPSLYLLASHSGQAPGSFQVVNGQLQLFGGEPYYLDQVIAAPQGQTTFTARLRFSEGNAPLRVNLCRKALLYSFGCHEVVLNKPATATPEQWVSLNTRIPGNQIPVSRSWPNAPFKLSISGPPQGLIEIKQLSLTDSRGNQLLDNRDFSQGLARWMPAIDFDPPWHIHQGGLDLLFALGLLGVATLGLLVIGVARVLFDAARKGQFSAAALLAGLAGLLTVSVTGSVFDEARLLFILVLIVFSTRTNLFKNARNE